MELQAYEYAKIYKERRKRWHNQCINKKFLHNGQKVLLFNSCLCLFPGKLRTRWYGPFLIKEVFPHGVVELMNEDGTNAFKVNGQCVKSYYRESLKRDKVSVDLQKIE